VSHADADITGIAYDSRKVKSGDLFIAAAGGTFDGHNYIEAAVEAGAAAVVSERRVELQDVPHAIVSDGRAAMGALAACFYGYPSRKMKLVGVTGTSGKTTVTHLVQSVFEASGISAGIIGTLGAKAGSELIETQHTTPESADIQRILSLMVERGVEAAAMEVSSHGLHQGRVLGCEFDCGVITNIARDHLDYHKTVEAYVDAKLMLFRDYPAMSEKKFHAVTNADDDYADQARSAARGEVITFGVKKDADVAARSVCVTESSVSFDLVYQGRSTAARLGIGGQFNVYNALAASAVGIAAGLDLEVVAAGLESARPVPGRFQAVDCGQDFGVLVDYAHTPDELENVLHTAREITSGKLIVVFGCGGDRDTGKRPIMGRIGSELADLAIITSDNPRSEDPQSIIADILRGIPEDARGRSVVRVDRAEAIREAISAAGAGDLVVIAGKGHEDYQVFADRTIHFDDAEVARQALLELN